ncbi:Inherit from KOG: fibrinogen [Seminavis robusta]|uniref:Inherit from KOG: fibrinogen n=1 Tax=Seminavis robusta TaxID=568900 RepID=A0A9N8HI48_9STRA|nr:Inherit from KOG: fibrinogen [Seminavis robusta]|eukprot:Sro676_g185750.1 Inherit from KOG: fibrinogen (497) ;mRNA; r:49143-51155
MMKLTGLFLSALLVGSSSATEKSLLLEQGRQLTDECDMYGYGCPPDKWCDVDELKCYRKRNPGERCNRDEKCLSENCVHNACRGTADPCLLIDCPWGTYCDNGQCVDDLCNHDHDCPQNEYCRNNGQCVRCFLDTHCASNSINKFCKSYECVGCRYDSHCLQGEKCMDLQCVNEGMCYGDDDCFNNWYCNNQGQCVECYRDNQCNQNQKCEDNYCVDIAHCYSDNECQNGWHCNSHGYCVECWLDNQCGQNEVCVNDQCIVHVECVNDNDCNHNEYCTSDNECEPKCYHSHDCAHGYWCDLYIHQCVALLQNGAICDYHDECESGWCRPRNNHPDICRAKKNNGASCNDDVECQSDFCYNGNCRSNLPVGDTCDYHHECDSGLNCLCTTWTCGYLKPAGASCDDNCECASDWCNNFYCRNRKGLGETCNGDWQCESGSCDNYDCGYWFMTYHCGSDTCVPVMGNIGDYCTQDYQCKSDRCRQHACRSSPGGGQHDW